MAGQNPVQFHQFSLREVGIITEAAVLRDARLAWQAAQYMRFAYHKPNDMPEEPGLPKAAPNQQSEADNAYVRAWMRAMHDRSRMQ